MTGVFIALLILLTLCSGFFSSSETSLFSLSPTRVRYFRTHRERKKRLVSILTSKPHDLLVTLLMLNVFVNIMIQNISANIFQSATSWLYTIGVPLVLTLFFGEIIPKSIALKNNNLVAPTVAPFIYSVYKLLGPIRELVGKITTYVTKVLFFYLNPNAEISKKELLHVLHTSEKQGILSAAESLLIEGFLDLQDILVKEIMRPREEILYFSLEQSLSDLEETFVKKEVSRIPVCKKDLEEVLGVINAYDFFMYREEITTIEELKPFIRKAFFVPESSTARSLLQQFSKKEETFSIVVDEYGTISGLCTKEDIMEVVVGDIQDQRDQHQLYTEAGSNVIIASGKMELAEFEDYFSIELPNPYMMVTIGGWITGEVGSIPLSGTKYQFHGFFFHILAADQKRIKRLYIRKQEVSTEDGV